MACCKFKGLNKRTQSDKLLKLKVIQNMTDIKEDKIQWFTSFLIKTLLKLVLKIKFKKSTNLKKLQKPVIRNLKKNEKCVDLADMQLISKYNKGTRFLLCALLCVLLSNNHKLGKLENGLKLQA